MNIKKFSSYALLILSFLWQSSLYANSSKNVNPSTSNAVALLASLPEQYLESQFQDIERAFNVRWDLFSKGRHFNAYKPNKTKQEIQDEFKQLNEWRLETWFVNPKDKQLISKADYMIAQELVEKGYYRTPRVIAFQYNLTNPMYNASTIVINGHRFFAFEGPKPEFVKNFFTVLQNHRVTQLVRLTKAEEQGKPKSSPYWLGRTKKDKEGNLILQIPQFNNKSPYTLYYYPVETWPDHHGVSPNTLLTLIQNVRKQFKEQPSGTLACHCAGGVGRTGTFLAAFALLDEIDKQISKGATPDTIDISIEKTVLQLSLQRPFMVAKEAQYETLYKLVDLYLKSISSTKTIS